MASLAGKVVLGIVTGGGSGIGQAAAQHPVGRIGKGAEVTNAVVWLSSESASFVTGQTLRVDGGFSTQ